MWFKLLTHLNIMIRTEKRIPKKGDLRKVIYPLGPYVAYEWQSYAVPTRGNSLEDGWVTDDYVDYVDPREGEKNLTEPKYVYLDKSGRAFDQEIQN